MLKPGGDADLAEKPVGTDRDGEILAQNLDRDLTVVLQIPRCIDGGHAPAADFSLYVVPIRERRGELLQSVRHTPPDPVTRRRDDTPPGEADLYYATTYRRRWFHVGIDARTVQRVGFRAMKRLAYDASAPGGVGLADSPDPIPGPGQILVRIAAAGLNRADVLQRRGGYPTPPGWPDIPGLEYAGRVAGLGPGVQRWQAGDRVMGLVGGGGHAELLVVNADEAIPVPDRLSDLEAAAVPESFLTAWDALVHRARVQPGERVLIHAVGSGLGTAAVQLAKRLGAIAAGTSRSAAKLEQAAALGLDEPVETASGTFRDRVSAPVDVILDVLGGPAFADNLAVLAPRGRLVLLGFLQGPQVETSLAPVLRKRLEVIGTVMRTRSAPERAELARDFAARVAPWLADGSVRPVVGAVFGMSEAASAHAAMEENRVYGKIVLAWR